MLTNNIHIPRDGVEMVEFLFRTGKYANRHNHSPKLILLDLKPPQLNGIGALRRYRDHPATQLIPVAVLTPSREEQDMTQTDRPHVNSYIFKSANFEQFTKSVKQLGFYWLLLNLPRA